MPHIKQLLDGFKDFQEKHYVNEDTMRQLVEEGAFPEVFMIACIDPRSGPSSVFNADPGIMFGKRTMAALVPPYDPDDHHSDFRAALTYAVEYKGIIDIIVMGHTHCGGVEALVTDIDDKDISIWMSTAKLALKEAVEKAGTKDAEELLRETERQAVILSMRNLMTYPAIEKAAKSGKLRIHGWMFDMEHGAILGYDLDTKSFKTLVEAQCTKSKGQDCGCGANNDPKRANGTNPNIKP
jgi:carbonic anhydrase